MTGGDRVHEWMTTGLDVIGLLLLAAGIGVVVGQAVAPGPGLIVAGVVVLAGSWWATRSARSSSTSTSEGEQ